VVETAPCRIVLIENQLLFGRAVAQVLSEDPAIEVTHVYRSVDEVPRPEGKDVPELAIVAVDGSPAAIATTFAKCRSKLPGARLFALAAVPEPDVMRRCLAAGADGFIGKDASVRDLLSAVKLLAIGTPYVDPRVAGAMPRRSQRAS
jgi:two-component system, NarL family, response regulator DesR